MNLLYFILVMYFFWLGAIASLNLYRGWMSGKLTYKMPVYYLAVPTMVAFVLMDWVMNRTVFMVLCWELPKSKGELVTQRMARYRADPRNTRNYRVAVADFVCDTLNLFNFNSEDHC